MQVQDFNPDAGTVAIRTSKSGKPRHVVLTNEGIILFKELSAGRSGHELILRRANGEPFRKSDQARPMIEACERAKITPRISFHILRHTWASLAVMNNVPLLVVAKISATETRGWSRSITAIWHRPMSLTRSVPARRYLASSPRPKLPRYGEQHGTADRICSLK